MAARQAEIFVSYRREDSQGFAGRISDALNAMFGHAAIFRDDEIRAGEDYSIALERALAGCDVLLVVIGQRWLTVCGADGEARIEREDDWVRLEVEAVANRGGWVLPVLVGGAQMPKASDLPPSLAFLSRQQAFVVTDRRWREDIDGLSELLERRIPSLKRSRMGRANAPIDDEIGARAAPRRRSTWAVRALKSLIGAAVLLLVAHFLLQRYGTAEMQRLPGEFVDYLRSLLSGVFASNNATTEQ